MLRVKRPFLYQETFRNRIGSKNFFLDYEYIVTNHRAAIAALDVYNVNISLSTSSLRN